MFEQNFAQFEILSIHFFNERMEMAFIKHYPTIPILVKHILTDFHGFIMIAVHSRSLLIKVAIMESNAAKLLNGRVDIHKGCVRHLGYKQKRICSASVPPAYSPAWSICANEVGGQGGRGDYRWTQSKLLHLQCEITLMQRLVSPVGSIQVQPGDFIHDNALMLKHP